MLLLFQHERKRLLVASCLSCLQGVSTPMVVLEGNSPLPQHHFWAGPWTKPTTAANSSSVVACAIKHLGTWITVLLNGILKKICCVLRSSSSSLIIES